MATTNSKIAAAKKLASKVKAKGKKKDYSPQNPPQYPQRYKEVNDEQVSAKPVGWRWTTKGATKVGANPDSRPKSADVEKYRNLTFKKEGVVHRYVYQEKRVDKSDKSRADKFENGGTLGAGSFKKGGATFSGRQYDPYREDIDLELTAKPVGYRYTDRLAKRLGVKEYARPTKEHIEKYLGKGVYRETREDKSDLKPTTSKKKASLESGGTLGAGSFARGGKVGMPEWSVTITSDSGETYDWVGHAKDEDSALHKAEVEAGFESVETGINMLSDKKGNKIEYKDGGSLVQRKGQYAKEHGTRASRSSDLVHQAKPVGWRYKGNKYREVTKKDLKEQLALPTSERNIYYETRRDKSDKSFDARLEQGGTLGAGSFARGGSTPYRPQYIPNEDIASITLTSGKVIKNNSIYDGAYVSKSIKLAQGGFAVGEGQFNMDGGMYARGGVVTDLRVLNQIAKKHDLTFDKKYKYYIGDAYKNNKGETLPLYFTLGDRVFKLQYYSGSFNPYLVEIDANKMVYNKETNEPAFPNYPNPKWDRDRYYTKTSDMMEDGGMYARGGVERIANTQAREYTENLIPFKGNNLEGKTLDNGDYVVLSYGYYPIWWYCKKQGKWYGNSTKYSVTTSKQMSQSRPTYDATMLSRNDLTDMMMKHNASYEDGGLLDNILSDTGAEGSQTVGGTAFSQGSLTPDMDITNPAF